MTEYLIKIKYYFTCLLLINCFTCSHALAQKWCGGDKPSTFAVESLRVKLAGESDFRAIDTENFCYYASDVVLGQEDTKIYNVGIATSVTSLIPDYPAGTEFEFILAAHDSSYEFGGIDAKAGKIRVSYGDEHHESPQKISVILESYQLKYPNTIADTKYYCENEILDHPSLASFYLRVNKRGSKIQSYPDRLIQAESVLAVGFPSITFDSSLVQMTYTYNFGQCAQTVTPYDSFVETFFPISLLNKFGLTPTILAALTDETIPLLFQSYADEGMEVLSFTARKSYGELQNIEGVSTSQTATGIVMRVEAKNIGFGYQSTSQSVSIKASTRKGGIKLKASASREIKACSTKKNGKLRMKPGYTFAKKGSNIYCKKIARK